MHAWHNLLLGAEERRPDGKMSGAAASAVERKNDRRENFGTVGLKLEAFGPRVVFMGTKYPPCFRKQVSNCGTPPMYFSMCLILKICRTSG